jgi:hypothetical protein
VPFPASGSSPPELNHDISQPRHFPRSPILARLRAYEWRSFNVVSNILSPKILCAIDREHKIVVIDVCQCIPYLAV